MKFKVVVHRIRTCAAVKDTFLRLSKVALCTRLPADSHGWSAGSPFSGSSITSLPIEVIGGPARDSGMQLMLDLCRDHLASTDHCHATCNGCSRQPTQFCQEPYKISLCCCMYPSRGGISATRGCLYSRHLEVLGRQPSFLQQPGCCLFMATSLKANVILLSDPRLTAARRIMLAGGRRASQGLGKTRARASGPWPGVVALLGL